jgi:hypothetical protein
LRGYNVAVRWTEDNGNVKEEMRELLLRKKRTVRMQSSSVDAWR